MRMALTIVLVSLQLARAGDVPKDKTPVKLTADSVRTLTLPPFTIRGTPQCDARGNLYFGTGSHPRRGVVLRLSGAGSTTLYRMADLGIEDPFLVGFHVTGDGKVWTLTWAEQDEKAYVAQFRGEDSSDFKLIRLKLPDGVKATDLRTFGGLENGSILAAGALEANSRNKDRGGYFVGIFDSSGELVRRSLRKVESDLLKQASVAHRLTVAETDGGETYVLQLNKVLVLSPGGAISRTIRLKPPAPGYNPVAMKANKRRLAVKFVKQISGDEFSGELVSLFALLDASTGEVLRVYEPTPEVGAGALACFSDEGFTFVRFDLNDKPSHLTLVTAAAK